MENKYIVPIPQIVDCPQNRNSQNVCASEMPCASSFIRSDSSYCPESPSNLAGFSIFEKDCLDYHNEYRILHGSHPLYLDRRMCNIAQEVANHMLTCGATNSKDMHRYGENVYISSGYVPISAKMAVKNWYNEKDDYKYGEMDYSMKTCHFTQLIWKKSILLGAAYAAQDEMVIVVCTYNPRGNLNGFYSENVFPLLEELNLAEPVVFEKIENPCKVKRDKKAKAKAAAERKKMLALLGEDEECVEEERICEDIQTDFFDYQYVALQAHNKWRALYVDVEPLELSLDCCNYAMQRAKQLLESEDAESDGYYNELISILDILEDVKDIPTEEVLNIEAVVDSWVEEGKTFKYNLEKPSYNPDTLRFTQVLWKGTKRMGCALARNDNKIVFVATYIPRGNKKGLFRLNIAKEITKPQPEIEEFLIKKPQHVSPYLTLPHREVPLYNDTQLSVVKLHNKLRGLHSIMPLEIDYDMCRAAQIVALELMHSKATAVPLVAHIGYGQNIYIGKTIQNCDFEGVLTRWYKEKRLFDFKEPRWHIDTQHFSQIIWKASERIGVAAITSDDTSIFVCFYYPPGNINGEFVHNITEV